MPLTPSSPIFSCNEHCLRLKQILPSTIVRITFLVTAMVFFYDQANLHAQPILYGMTSQGGNGEGTIIKMDVGTNTLTNPFSWESIGFNPEILVEASNGKLYGMTGSGGFGHGTIFSFNPATNTHQKLFDFNGSNGSIPRGGLIQAVNGKLYGITDIGGTFGVGTIFSFDPATNTHVKLFDFSGSNGSNPNSTLFQAFNGKLYGMTSVGGAHNQGTIFSFDPTTDIQEKVFDFNHINGTYPGSSFIQAVDGKLYSMTSDGGIDNQGTIFSFDPATNTQTSIFEFNGANGSNPYGSLIQAANGKLYGMTSDGGTNDQGTIFSFDPVANSHTRHIDFGGTRGRFPYGSFVQAVDGKLYGTTLLGGIYGQGSIFSFDPHTNAQEVYFAFNGSNGSYPTSSLIQVVNGKLYGMTSGGSGGKGTIFSLDLVTKTHLKLFGFNNINGSTPVGSLVQAAGGNLYGVTSSGGINGVGTIFSFDPLTNLQSKLLDFNYVNGSSPVGSLIEATNRKLYGMTSGGWGTIFSFEPATNTHTTLFGFDITNGYSPRGSLIQARNNKLYGMTWGGGVKGFGTIFCFDIKSNTHVKLFDFNGTNGSYPYGSLVQAVNGKLYGMTNSGGINGVGTIFSIDPSTNIHVKLFDFNGTNGANPNGNLVQSVNGKLYGMTYAGGDSSQGTIFSFDPTANTHVKLLDFNITNGIFPAGSLMQAVDERLYGTTNRGGTNIFGTIFSFDPATNTFVKLQDFTDINGAYPQYGSFIEYKMPPAAGSVYITDPLDKSIFSAGSHITLTAQTYNPSGTILRLDFFEGSSLLGSDNSAPYTYTGNDVTAGVYRVSAIAITSTGDTLRSDTITVNVTACAPSGLISGEGYTSIPGSAVANLTSHPSFPAGPSITASLTSLEYISVGDNYGGRLRGYICTPQTGDYIFYISGDDQAGLWLSTDDNPSNKQLIAYTVTPTSFREWNKFTTQQSAPIRLVAGGRYYIETLHKESNGPDHLSVGWKLPSQVLERPIAGNRLSEFNISGPSAGTRLSFEESMRAALQTELSIRVTPNPSAGSFTISLQTASVEPIRLTVTDIAGRVIETRASISPNTQIQMGAAWKPGLYILQVQQGAVNKTIKLIRE